MLDRWQLEDRHLLGMRGHACVVVLRAQPGTKDGAALQ